MGASAGASVGSVVSQGISADRMFRALRDPADSFFPLKREDVYSVEPLVWARAGARLALRAARRFVSRGSQGAINLPGAFEELLPAGIFRLDRYAAFLRAFYAREGLSARFRDLTKELYVVASDLDSTERVVFGDEPLRDVDIASAVAASSAIPMFFEPARIEGRDYIDGGVGRVAHLDVAIEHEADRIVVINPVVPLRNASGAVCLPSGTGECLRVRDQGLLQIASQAWRITSRVRLALGIKRYLAEHPHVQVLLIEPSETNTLLFTNGSMGLGARAEILDYARSQARRALEETLRSGVEVLRIDSSTEAPWSRRAGA